MNATPAQATVLPFCPLGEPGVGPTGVQADGAALPIKATDRTQPVLGVPDQCSPLHPKGTRPAVGFASAAFGCLQPMELSAMQHGRHQRRVHVGCSAPLIDAANTQLSTQCDS